MVCASLRAFGDCPRIGLLVICSDIMDRLHCHRLAAPDLLNSGCFSASMPNFMPITSS